MKLDKQDEQQLLDELEQAGARIKNAKSIHCPFEGHSNGDQNASAGIYESSGGWRYKCQGCGVNYSVIDVHAHNNGLGIGEALALNADTQTGDYKKLRQTPVKKEKPAKPPVNAPQRYSKKDIHKQFCRHGSPSYYPFKNQAGDIVTYEVHIGSGKGKKVWPMTPVGDGMYVMKNIPAPRPIYNLDLLADHQQVIVCEGPKDCETLAQYGFMATTSLNGAGNAHHSDWSPLANKDIVILPDNDGNGVEYAQSVLELCNHADSVAIVDPKCYGIDKKGADITDVVEMLEGEGQSFDQIRAVISSVIASAKFKSDTADYLEYVEQRTSNGFRPVTTPFPLLDYQCFGESGIEPGSLVLLGGAPGVGKTWFILQMIQHWNECGTKSASLFMESTRVMYTKRALALASGRCDVMSAKYLGSLAKPERERLLMSYADDVNNIMKTITTTYNDEKVIDYDFVLEWATSAVMNGAEVIVIDPITYANTSDKPWKADQEITKKLAKLMEQFGRRCIMVTHPRGEIKPNASLIDQFAGGKGFVRFSTSALFLTKANDHGDLIDGGGNIMDSAWNRKISIAKSRDSMGANKSIAYTYSERALKLTERGIIREKGVE